MVPNKVDLVGRVRAETSGLAVAVFLRSIALHILRFA
jgi:hypothetical protein